MHIKEESSTIVTKGIDGNIIRVDESCSRDLVLDKGDDAANMTEEQKEAVLKHAFLGLKEGKPDPPVKELQVYTPEEHGLIDADLSNMYPKGATPVMEGTMHVASNKLVGPPTEVPHETRVEKTSTSGNQDNVPPARRSRT